MNLRDYKEIINKTAVYPKVVTDFGISYAAWGFLDEKEEYYEKIQLFNEVPNDITIEDIRKEFFDVVWYATAMCLEADLDYFRVMNDVIEGNDDLDIPIGVYGNIKKFYRDGKPINKELMENYLIRTLLQMSEVYPDIMDEKEFLIGLEENYNKLIKRRENNTIHGDGDNR